jgi:multidrug resistance efflux pump
MSGVNGNASSSFLEQKLTIIERARSGLSSRSDRALPKAVFTLSAVIVAALLAGLFVPIETSVAGTGFLYGSAPPATLVAPFSGSVQEVLQEPRMAVEAGTKLAVLTPASGSRTSDELDAQIKTATEKQEELQAALDVANRMMMGGAVSAIGQPAPVAAAIGQADLQRSRAASAARARSSANRRVVLAQSALANAEAQAERKRELIARGVLPRNSGLELDAALIDLHQRLEAAQSESEASEAEHVAAQQQLSALLLQLRAQFTEELRTNSTRLSELRISRAAMDQQDAQATIIAPTGGYLEQLEPVFAGRSIAAGDRLYTITPVSTSFTVRALVPNKSVSDVAAGQTVRVRIDALTKSPFKYYDGEVVRVFEEPEVLPPGMMMLPAAARRAPEYTVEVSIDYLPVSDSLLLRTGMRAEVQILSGKRSPMAYIFGPLIQRVRPFSEP